MKTLHRHYFDTLHHILWYVNRNNTNFVGYVPILTHLVLPNNNLRPDALSKRDKIKGLRPVRGGGGAVVTMQECASVLWQHDILHLKYEYRARSDSCFACVLPSMLRHLVPLKWVNICQCNGLVPSLTELSLTCKQLDHFFKSWFNFLQLFSINVAFLCEISPIQRMI